MTTVDHGEHDPAGAQPQLGVDHGAEAFGVFHFEEGVVHGGGHIHPGAKAGRRPSGVADDGGHGCRRRTFAGHVANEEAPVVVADAEGVVEIAPDLQVQAGGLIPGGELDSRDEGQARRQESLLQRVGHVAGMGERPGVGDGGGRSPGELFGQRHVGRFVRLTPRRRREDQHPDPLAPDDQRDDHRRSQFKLPDEGHGFAVQCRPQPPFVDRRQDAGAPAADDGSRLGTVGDGDVPERIEDRSLGPVKVGSGHNPQASGIVDQPDQAGVAEDSEPDFGQSLQRPAVVERGSQDPSGLRQEGESGLLIVLEGVRAGPGSRHHGPLLPNFSRCA